MLTLEWKITMSLSHYIAYEEKTNAVKKKDRFTKYYNPNVREKNKWPYLRKFLIQLKFNFQLKPFHDYSSIPSSGGITIIFRQHNFSASHVIAGLFAIPVNSRQPEELVYTDLALIPG